MGGGSARQWWWLTGDDHHVCLTRGGAEDDAEAVHVISRGRCVHHLHCASCETEGHRPEGRLARPVRQPVEASQHVLNALDRGKRSHLICTQLAHLAERSIAGVAPLQRHRASGRNMRRRRPRPSRQRLRQAPRGQSPSRPEHLPMRAPSWKVRCDCFALTEASFPPAPWAAHSFASTLEQVYLDHGALSPHALDLRSGDFRLELDL